MELIPVFALVVWFGMFYFIHSRIKPDSCEAPEQEYTNIELCITIVFRNEAQNLSLCLQSISESEGIAQTMDVLLVNDHSTDASLSEIDAAKSRYSNLRITILDNKGVGKKDGLLTALEHVHHQWLYLTDADCQLNSTTLNRLMNLALTENKPVVFAPVSYRITSLASRFLQYENLNTQSVSEAFLSFGHPLMVNGANILLHRDVKADYIRAQRMEYVGGDDVFFAQSLNGNAYAYCYDNGSSVMTKTAQSFKEFIHQRMRWVSKTPGYHWIGHWAFSVVLMVCSLLFSYTFIMWVVGGMLSDVWLLTLVAKWFVEYSYHRLWFRKYAFEARWYDSLLISILYPLYTLALGVLAFLPVSFRWKDRKLNAKTDITPL